jgi:glucan phosphorylase
MNGVINLSILDGWWTRLRRRTAGRSSRPLKLDPHRRDREEARTR